MAPEEQLEEQARDLGIDRRRQQRKSVRVSATVLLPDDELLYGHTLDVSSGGACLSVSKALQAGDEIRLGLQFEAVGTRHNLLLIARVCYCAPQAEGFRAGLQFVQISAEDSALIHTLLS